MASLSVATGFYRGDTDLAEIISAPSDARFFKVFSFEQGRFIRSSVDGSEWWEADELDSVQLNSGRVAVRSWTPDSGVSSFSFGSVATGAPVDSHIEVPPRELSAGTQVTLDELLDTSDLRDEDFVNAVVRRGGETLTRTGFVSADELGDFSLNAGATGQTTEVFTDTFLSGAGTRSGWSSRTLPTSGSDADYVVSDFGSLQAALNDEANRADDELVIEVAEDIDLGAQAASYNGEADLTLRSTSDEQRTLDAAGLSRVLNVGLPDDIGVTDREVAIEDLRLANGNVEGGGVRGAGLNVEGDVGRLRIEDSAFVGNELSRADGLVATKGGALDTGDAEEVVIRNSEFTDNAATTAGALLLGLSEEVAIASSRFANNKAKGGENIEGRGGAIALNSALGLGDRSRPH